MTKSWPPAMPSPRSFRLIWPRPAPRNSTSCAHRSNPNSKESCTALSIAAHFKNFQALSELQPFDWIEPLQVNLMAPWGLTRACFGLLEATENSTVMFVTCAAGHEAKAFQGTYGVTKSALEGMARTWSVEQRKVRIELFDPGPMRTALRRLGYPGELDAETPPPEERLAALIARLRGTATAD